MPYVPKIIISCCYEWDPRYHQVLILLTIRFWLPFRKSIIDECFSKNNVVDIIKSFVSNFPFPFTNSIGEVHPIIKSPHLC